MGLDRYAGKIGKCVVLQVRGQLVPNEGNSLAAAVVIDMSFVPVRKKINANYHEHESWQ